jgi:26S proteasome regulatory subunit N5
VQHVYGEDLRATDIFAIDKGDGKGQLRWEILAKRVTEHVPHNHPLLPTPLSNLFGQNVRVIAKYFTRIRMDRLTTFLDLSEEESEKYLSEMVTSGAIYARIDRPAKTISFEKPKDANDVLNEWSGNIHNLLGLCEKLGHLITKVPPRFGDVGLTGCLGGDDECCG